MRGTSVYSKALVTAHPFSWIDIYGQFLYSDPKTTVNFNEAAAGNFLLISQLLFYSSQQTIGTGAANQPHTTGTAGFELRPLKRMRIFESWMTDRYHDAAYPAFCDRGRRRPPAAGRRSEPAASRQLQPGAGGRYVRCRARRSRCAAATGISGATPPPSDAIPDPLGGRSRGNWSAMWALAGINFRASEKISFNLDYEGGD